MSNRGANDTELIVWNLIRTEYENKFNVQHNPIALKYIIIQFTKRIIECDQMLTIKEDLDFFRLISKKFSKEIRKFRNLYKASDHNYPHKAFHTLCDYKSSTITIIPSNHVNVFGGCTTSLC